MKRNPHAFLLGYLLSVAFQPFLAKADSAFLKDDKICVSSESRDCFAPKLTGGHDELKLIGATFFSWMFFDVYSAALYGTDGIAAEKNFNGTEPVMLEIRYRRSFKKSEMISTAEKILRNQNAPLNDLQPRLDKINAAYRDVVDGDTYILAYTPLNGGETSLIFNGELQTTVPGKDFAVNYFNIWLAEQGAFDKKVREALVNSRCAKPLIACI